MSLPDIIEKKIIMQSRLFSVEEATVEFSNGNRRIFERFVGNQQNVGSVMVVPVLNKDTILLIKEYMFGLHQYQLTFPKGLVDSDETLEEAANRELQEEIGYGAKKLQLLKVVSLAPNYFAANMGLFLAHDLYPSRLSGDEPEPLEIMNWSLSCIDELLERKDFTEARAISALFLALQKL